MTTAEFSFFASCLAMALVIVVCIQFYKLGHKHGIEDADAGYEKGRKAADNWWIGAESEIERERRQLWEKERRER